MFPFNLFGFDKDGYNEQGFDKMGYNREGYDREGYDKTGYNKQGINKLTHRDREGYDSEGYDINGCDREGYDKEGFDIAGFDRLGFDRDGFNHDGFDCNGFNRDGFDREGFNQAGFNADGYDRDGFDKEGYNRKGYDKEGYDRNGYDLRGYNKDGYDKEGYDLNGFDKEGYDNNGFGLDGYDREGYNVYGYDNDGFNRDGMTIDGFSRDVFDENGFNIYTGFNKYGYDREGFNINGIDKEGFDRDGFNIETGLDREKYDKNGFDLRGYNREGYDQQGYDKNGYDKEGYDREGYDREGYDHLGFDRRGYDRKGYDLNGYNKEGDSKPELKKLLQTSNLDPQENKLEYEYYGRSIKEIQGKYASWLKDSIYKKYNFKTIERRWIDREGFVQYDYIAPNTEIAEREWKNTLFEAKREPYFAHISYKETPELYIGKNEIPGVATSWADPRAQLYYQYQIYIGNEDIDFDYVRNIIFENGRYDSYKDLYNKNPQEIAIDYNKNADEHLTRIIATNRQNKSVHDIIVSIQRNQYKIISSDKDKSMMVLGCAGSGKTMILMHKIHYMKYNDEKLSMEDIIVISPTDILSRESRELSKLLQVTQINQYTTASFYKHIIQHFLEKLNIRYDDFCINDAGPINVALYNQNNINAAISNIIEKLNAVSGNRKIRSEEIDALKKDLQEHVDKIHLNEKDLSEMYKDYNESMDSLHKYGTNDFEKLIYQIDKKTEKETSYIEEIEWFRFLLSQKCFTKTNSILRNLSQKAEEEKNNDAVKQSNEDKFQEYSKRTYYSNMLYARLNKNALYEYGSSLPDHIGDKQTLIALQPILDKKLSKQEFSQILNEWKNLMPFEVEEYLQLVQEKLENIKVLRKKKEAIQLILNKKMVLEKEASTNIDADHTLNKLGELFYKAGDSFTETEYDPLSYFDVYAKIKRRQNRLRDQKNNYSYLFDIMLESLDVHYTYDTSIEIPIDKAFIMTCTFQRIMKSASNQKKYIFIDEFQDFSKTELELIKKLYPAGVINLFGDVNQCISEKGIQNATDLPADSSIQKFKLNENYRNAKEITDYVNLKQNMNMMAVGLHGIAKEYENIFPRISIEKDDRVSIIVNNENVEDCEKFLFDNGIAVNVYDKSREIIRGKYNLMSISYAKGLEFEKVIVIRKGMSHNQFYVACTRAIEELYVIKEMPRK